MKGKKGSYDAYLIMEGMEDYSYTKDRKEIKGFQYKVKLEFLKKKKYRVCFYMQGHTGKSVCP